MSKFERIVEFSPAYDKRSSIPRKNFGICPVHIKFILVKNGKAVQFMCSTDWFLPETVKEYREKGVVGFKSSIDLRGEKDCGINGWDVGYHSPTRIFKDQTCRFDCPYTKTGKCYYDFSFIQAIGLEDVLIREGSDGIWKYLEGYWKSMFGRKKR